MRAYDELEENKKRKKPFVDDEPDDMEETLELPVQQPLNKTASIFDENSFGKTSGINTELSVFDKSAVFKITESN